MSESVRQKSQIGVLESHVCGLMIVFTFFCEHFKFFGMPLYIYPLILCLFLLLVNNHFKIRKPKGIQFSRIETFSTILIVLATITLPFSVRTVGTQPYIKTVVTALIMLVVAKNIYDEESFELVLKYVLIGIIITAAASGYELITGHHFFAKVLTNDRLYRMGRDNSFGFQVNVNDNASLMALSVFISTFLLRAKRKRVLSIALIVILLGITATIDARLPLLALFAVAIEMVVLIVISRLKKGAMPKIVVGTIVFVTCIIFFSIYSVSGILSLLSNNQSYQYDAARLSFMSSAVKTISPISFLFGRGCGVTQELIGGYSIHSVLIELLCDNGILAAACFMYLIIRLQFSFADRISSFRSILFPCFATAFFLISFCSSSMLRIRSIWVYLVVVWQYYMLGLFETEEMNNSAYIG